MAFLPAICRAIYRDDHIAFGKSQNARYVFGFGFVGSLFPIFMLFTYITNCSMEMNFRFKASKFMRNLLCQRVVCNIHSKFYTHIRMKVEIIISNTCSTTIFLP